MASRQIEIEWYRSESGERWIAVDIVVSQVRATVERVKTGYNVTLRSPLLVSDRPMVATFDEVREMVERAIESPCG